MVSEDACAGGPAGGSASLLPNLCGFPLVGLRSTLTSYPLGEEDGMEMGGMATGMLGRGLWEGVLWLRVVCRSGAGRWREGLGAGASGAAKSPRGSIGGAWKARGARGPRVGADGGSGRSVLRTM